jgi:uncharacterized protein (TIGR04255 family)
MKIDFSEKFPHLSNAPIMEAVIDFRAKPSISCEQEQFLNYFKQEFSDFPVVASNSNTVYHFNPAATQPAPPSTFWNGLTLHSSDKLRIAQCQKDGFSLSHLPPYPHWEKFAGDALAMWGKYKALTKPTEIQRIGVRFINRIPITTPAVELNDYLIDAPKNLSAFPLPRLGFVHSDTFIVPGTNYMVHVISALQPPDAITHLPAVILDTDISTTTPSSTEDQLLTPKLQEMRWLKNKIFFASLNKKVIDSFNV